MTGEQNRANIGKNVLKIPHQKSTRMVPTNSAGKSFSNRIEFTLVAVSKGLVAQSVKSWTGTKSTLQKEEYYRFRSNRIKTKWRKLGYGSLLKYADKMYKTKVDKELKTDTEIKQVMRFFDEAQCRDSSLLHQRGLDSFMPMPYASG